jgi:hypothetical protein
MIFGSSLLVACGSSSSGGGDATTGTGGSGTAGSGTGATGGSGVAGTGGGTAGTGTGGSTGGTGGGTAGSGTGGTGGGKAGSGGTAAGGKGGAGGGKAGSGGTGTGGMGTGGTGMVMTACDPTKGQDVCKMGEKCSATTGMGTQPACNGPVAGGAFTVDEGQDCKRSVLGIDNCKPGLICTLRGVLDADSTNMHTQCKKWCQSDADCTGSQACNAFTSDASGASDGAFGVCVDACQPFTPCTPFDTGMGGAGGAGAGGSGAGGGGNKNLTCSDPSRDNDLMGSFFSCHSIGSGLPGDVCTQSKDCGNNMFCGVDPANPTSMMGLCTEWCTLMDPNGLPDHDCSKKGQACASMGMGIDICMLDEPRAAQAALDDPLLRRRTRGFSFSIRRLITTDHGTEE